MKISYNWLQSYFNEKLPVPEKLAELLTAHSQEVDAVEPKNGDFEFEVKVLPNRAYDYVNYFGVVKDIAAILKLDAKISLPEPKKREIIFVKESDFEKILGVKIPEKEILDILRRLGMEISKKEEIFSIGVSPERTDLKIKEDIAEEVARIYGYEKIKEIIPDGLLIPPKRNDVLFFASSVKSIMVGLGFFEVYNYSFSKKGVLELQKPHSEDKKFLRTNLTDGLFLNIKENDKYAKDIKIFEIGNIFPKTGETLALAAAVSKNDFYRMKGVVDAVLEGLGIADFYYKDSKKSAAEIRIGDAAIGKVGMNYFELNFDQLAKLTNEELEYKPISKYPSVARDIAIFTPIETRVAEVEDAIQNAAGELLADSDLFDIYENDEQKSLAFHLIFQSKEKTLTDDEVNAIMKKIFEAMEANNEWEVRKQK